MKSFVASHSRYTPAQIQLELQNKGIKASKIDITNELYKVNKELYPKDSFLAFSPEYCKSADGKQNIFQGYFKVPIASKNTLYSEIVILASNFQLARLSDSTEWFVDGTFWSAPRNFTQMLNIIVYSEALSRYICVAHILLGTKKKAEYDLAFQNLIFMAKNSGYNLKPQFIMADFEEALRNSLKTAFPEAEILGCQFHFMKALWKKATKIGLKVKERKLQTKTLITFLMILVHSNINERKKEIF